MKTTSAMAVKEYIKQIHNESKRKGLSAVFDLQAYFFSKADSNRFGYLTKIHILYHLAADFPFYTRGRRPVAHNIEILKDTEID